MQTKSTRTRRLETLQKLVRSERPRSQAELQGLLAKRGHEVNQATLSRDLRELGVVKGPDGYQLQGELVPADRLGRALGDWLIRVSPVANQIVLRTSPGGATPIALALDADPPSGVLGTIAGDDTVLVVCDGAKSARAVAEQLGRRLSA